MFSCEFCEISENTFLHRTPLVAASAFLSLAQSMLIFLSFRSLLFRPNQHLSNKSIKQTINSWRIVLIGYWRTVQHIMTWLQQRKTVCTSWTKTSRLHNQIGVASFASFRQEKPWRQNRAPSPFFVIVRLLMRP